MNQVVILAGNPVDGLTGHGPADKDEAIEWAGENLDCDWWVLPIESIHVSAPTATETATEPTTGSLLMALAVIRELTGTQRTTTVDATIDAVKGLLAERDSGANARDALRAERDALHNAALAARTEILALTRVGGKGLMTDKVLQALHDVLAVKS